mgnify:CR=1 FL=1
MPPLVPMQLAIAELTEQHLTLTAPLAANINDKGTAFGGSLTSLMTLACWGLVTAVLRDHGLDCDVYVAESTVKYLKPVREDLAATATFTDDSNIAACIEQLKAKGKAKLWLHAQVVLLDGTVAATMHGKYAAFVRST